MVTKAQDFYAFLRSRGINLGSFSTDTMAAHYRVQLEALRDELIREGNELEAQVRAVLRRMPENRITNANASVAVATQVAPKADDGMDDLNDFLKGG